MIQIREKNQGHPLIIINGKYQNDEFDLQSISPNKVNTIDIMSGEDALQIFGEKGVNGAIFITMNKKGLSVR